jgi:hypothetical protein
MVIEPFFNRVLLIIVIILIYAPASQAATTLPPTLGGSTDNVSLGRIQLKGPTENITKIANAISVRAKSLTTLVVVAPGVALTQPVRISIFYYSDGGTNIINQSYVASSGNHFLYNDKAGDGLPRQRRMDIRLIENNPRGANFLYTIPVVRNLDPLYRVSIGPLRFTLVNDCDRVRKSEITFLWNTPEGEDLSAKFSTQAGSSYFVNAFAWSAAEVAVSAKLMVPGLKFRENDPGLFGYDPPRSPARTGVILVPGKSRMIRGVVSEEKSQCSANYRYWFQSTLNQYPFL